MKKIKSLLVIMMLFAICLVNTSVSAESTAPATITYTNRNFDETWYVSYSGVHMSLKTTPEGKYVYCLHPRKNADYNATQYTKGEQKSDAYVYILEQEMSTNASFGEVKGYFSTGLAIWYLASPTDEYFNDFEDANGNLVNYYNRDKCGDAAGTACQNSDQIASKLKQLVDGSKSYNVTKPNITASPSSSALKLSEDKMYYVSGELGIKTTGTIQDSNGKSEYTVSLQNAPSGTIIVNASGVEATTFNVGDKYIVKVPVESIGNELNLDFSVKITSTGKFNEAWQYDPADTSLQSVVALYPNYYDLSATATLNLSLTTKTQFSKKDATTGEELPGATLQILDENKEEIKDEDGEVLYKWISRDKPYVIEGLPVGKYYLKEVIAPEGYELTETLVEFEVKNDGTVTKVEMKNEIEEVPVPDTGMNRTIIYSVLSGILLISGGSLIYLITKRRKIS